MASGRGSNARALIEYCSSLENLNNEIKWNICAVISDRPNAGVLEIATDLGVKSVSLPYPKGQAANAVERRTKYSNELANKIKQIGEELSHPIDFVICAGFMKILTRDFLVCFKDPKLPFYRVLNIHPSLLPAFAGANAYEDAFHYGVKVSGATTHFVDEQVDHGPIILQQYFERKADDTIEDFKSRGLSVEHPLFIKTLKNIQNNKLRFISSDNERLFVKVLED